jgi:transcriptional regulator with XRE-family HTH domain
VDLGAAIGRNQATLTNWEQGRTRLSAPDLAALSRELGLNSTEESQLIQLREESLRPNDWAGFNLSESLRPFVVMEDEASEISTFQQVLVPGLLQTEDYVRALLVAASSDLTATDIELRVRSRIRRQRKLEDPHFHLHAVIAEPVLMAQVGEPAEFAHQLETLIEHAQRKNVVLQVVPASKGAHPGADGSFSLLGFNDGNSSPLAYFDTPLGGNMVTNSRDVDLLATTLELVCEFAETPEKSLKIVEKALRGNRKQLRR